MAKRLSDWLRTWSFLPSLPPQDFNEDSRGIVEVEAWMLQVMAVMLSMFIAAHIWTKLGDLIFGMGKDGIQDVAEKPTKPTNSEKVYDAFDEL